MKFSLLIIAFILSYTTTINSQKINQEVHIENQQPFLLGKITPEALSTNTYKTWYLPNFSNYEADTEKIKLIKEHLNAYKILEKLVPIKQPIQLFYILKFGKIKLEWIPYIG